MLKRLVRKLFKKKPIHVIIDIDRKNGVISAVSFESFKEYEKYKNNRDAAELAMRWLNAGVPKEFVFDFMGFPKMEGPDKK